MRLLPQEALFLTKLRPHEVHTHPSTHGGGTLPPRKTWGEPRPEQPCPVSTFLALLPLFESILYWIERASLTQLPHRVPCRLEGEGQHSEGAQIHWSPPGKGLPRSGRLQASPAQGQTWQLGWGSACPGGLSPDPQGSPPALASERGRRPSVQSGVGSPLACASVCLSAEQGNGASSLRPHGNEMSGCSCHFGTVSGPRWGLCKH